MPLLEGLVNGGLAGLPAFLSENLFLTVPLLLALALLFFLRPRKAGSKYKDAPPMVTKSTVSSVPLLGPAIEFGKSPVKMVKRCYDDYGPVFTVPVRLKKDGRWNAMGLRVTLHAYVLCCFFRLVPWSIAPLHWHVVGWDRYCRYRGQFAHAWQLGMLVCGIFSAYICSHNLYASLPPRLLGASVGTNAYGHCRCRCFNMQRTLCCG